MNRASGLLAVGAIALLPAAGIAQICNGTASFAAAPVRVAAGFESSDGVKTYGLNLAGGAPDGLYGSATLSRAEYDNVANAGVVLGTTVGYAVDVTPTKSAQFCPEVGYSYQTGPDVDTGFGTVSVSAHAFSFGGSFGGAVPMSPTFDFIPFVSAAYVISQISASAGGSSASSSEDYTAVGIGAGFVINKILTLQPMVSIPVGLQNGKSTFGLALGFNFGSSSGHR